MKRLLALFTLLALAGCGGGTDVGKGNAGPAGEITVLAAASLTGTSTELGSRFEKAHAGTKVTFSFGASSTLARQVNEGAPADVFAAASKSTMDTVTKAGNADGQPVNFVANRLQIAVPEGNPGNVTRLTDFANDRLRIALCAKQVPCGSAAVTAFAAAGITPKPDTYEQDVKAALAQVSSGEVDAALVYRTDVLAAGDAVEGIDFPESAKAVNTYPIVTLRHAPNPALAKAFVAYVFSPEGRKVLTDAGFEAP